MLSQFSMKLFFKCIRKNLSKNSLKAFLPIKYLIRKVNNKKLQYFFYNVLATTVVKLQINKNWIPVGKEKIR